MAWPNKQLTAEEILGMKPEDLRNRLESTVTKEDLAETKAQIEAQNNSLSEIRDMLSKLTTPPPQTDPVQEADLSDPTTAMLTDPAGFVQRQTAGITAQASAARADILEMRARQKYPQAFARYNDELMASANNFSISQRSQPGFWDFHIQTFTGQKYLSGELQQGSYPSLMGASTVSSGGVEDPKDPNHGFNPEVAAFLKERGVPLDKAAKINQIMKVNGDPISMENWKGKAANA